MKKMISRRSFLAAAGVSGCCSGPDRLRRLFQQHRCFHCRFHRCKHCWLHCRCFR